MKTAAIASTFALGLTALFAIPACGDDTATGGATSSSTTGATTAPTTTTGTSSTHSSTATGTATTTSTSSSVSTGSGGNFMLTSTAFNDGDMMPDVFTCSGDNHSPPLSWSGLPAGTMSIAIDFTDMSNGLTHWGIWDIDPAVTSLAENLDNNYELTDPAGAHQAAFSGGHGFAGPCPGGNLHTYVFTIHALDVGALPGINMSSGRDDAKTVMEAHDIGHTSLTVMSDANGGG